ncbi:predicted protein [Sparassis crispa]|uniref:FHA domain-containing protein n=1 Tax=Sparassis crispa TaxID=139825 RepID=A0A401H006_9APHY|nr:predicted protein [Sparassis crispa]GBE87730.1 predicted protein [Sparassis crispa]
MPAPFSTPHTPVAYPALYLYPLNDSFIPKHISLLNNQRVKIGRQTNAKTVPAERNGYFDSKVLSRQHAEVWEESGKIFIKDVKSSNGTFINGERLSPEGLESEPFELKTDDIVEFGIDIVGEDNKTIIHHKVAARVVCVFSEQDAQAAARAEAQQNPPAYGSLANQGPSGSAAGAFNFAGGQQAGAAGLGNGVPGAQRRPGMQPQGLVGMGGMGGNVRVPGKSGLTFDHILSRLQGELQKSRDTGSELHSLTGSMNEIHDTLGGNMPPNVPPYPQSLPAVMPAQAVEHHQQQEQHQQQPAPFDPTFTLSELQTQLRETQMSLASHVDKIRALEGVLAEHDAIKREVGSMRDMMEERMREIELLRRQSGSPIHQRQRQDERDHDGDLLGDDDDARSIATVVPHELERVDEEDEEQLAAEQEEEDRRRRREELGRPRTPEPTGMGMGDDDEDHDSHPNHLQGGNSDLSHLRARPHSPLSPPVPHVTASSSEDVTERLDTLSKQLESALELSRSLEAQHTNAQSTILNLETKVSALETLVLATRVQVDVQEEKTQQLAEAAEATALERPTTLAQSREEERARERESLTEMITEWKKSVEGRWSGVQEEWNDERERLRRAKEEWELRVRSVEEGLGSAVTKMESGLTSLASFQAHYQLLQRHPLTNGNAKINGSGGLVTPPSPRSLSAESTRPRARKKRVSKSRGRTRSRSASLGTGEVPYDGSSASSVVSDLNGQELPPYSNSHPRRRSPWATDESSASDSETRSSVILENGRAASSTRNEKDVPFPSPESSVVHQPLSKSDAVSGVATDARTREPPKDIPQFTHLSMAVGILVLSAATAAVLWRVKPETSI